MDRSLSQAGDSLGQRQKHSINAFIARNEWIQEKSQLLENSILPDIAHLDGTESQTLDELWKQHNQIETEVDALDQGELRSLRLLAKAASQKQLSSEDTDLLEVTFHTLDSLDKLLRLLRTRSKALQLLRMRMRWNRQRKEVDTEYQSIITDGLSRFLKRARWAIPDAGKETSDASQSTKRGTTMSRQMKGETLSLDLASMNSRLHTLQYSTLAESGRILDAMIDAATIPETFIDLQETLETQVKEGLKGLPEFCGGLAKQWREADEIWWTCSNETANMETLKRDAEEANLKLPSEELAKSFQERLSKSQDILLRLSQSAIQPLPAPLHPVRVPDQDTHNITLKQSLELRHRECINQQRQVHAVVRTYSEAAEALVAGNTIKDNVLQHLHCMRTLGTSLSVTTIDAGVFGASTSGVPPSQDFGLQDGEALVSIAETKLLPRAAGVVAQLQKAGIDPNIRQSIQECLLALASETAQLKKLLQKESKRRDYISRSRYLYASLAQQQKEAEDALSELRGAIPSALWREHRSHNDSPVVSKANSALEERLSRRQGLQIDLSALTSQASKDNDLEGSELPGERLSRQLETAVKQDQQVAEMSRLLGLLESQSASVNKHVDLGQRLANDLGDLLKEISDPSKAELLDQLRERYTELKIRLEDYRRAIVDDVPFVSSQGVEASSDIRRTDEAIRNYLNSLCVKLSTLLSECDSSLQPLSELLAAELELSDIRRSYDGLRIANTAGDDAASVSKPHAKYVASVEELRDLRIRLLRTQSNLESTAVEERQEKLKGRRSRMAASLEALIQSVQAEDLALQARMSHTMSSEPPPALEDSGSSSTSDALSSSTSGAGSNSEEREFKCSASTSDAGSESPNPDRKYTTNKQHSLAEVPSDAERPDRTPDANDIYPVDAKHADSSLTSGRDTLPPAEDKVPLLAARAAEVDDRQEDTSNGSQEPSEDVFGPEVYTSDRSRTTTASTKASTNSRSSENKDASLEVKPAIEDLNQAIAAITFPSNLSKSTSLRLPNMTEAEALQRQVSLVHAHFDDLQNTYKIDEETLEATRASLRDCTEQLMQTMQLASFSAKVNQCDEAFSDLLDVIDQTDSIELQQSLRSAEDSVRQATQASLCIPNDNRVVVNMERLSRTWRDLAAHVAGDEDRASVSASVMSRSSSVASSLSGIPKAKRAASAHHSKPVGEHTAALTPRVRSSGSLSRIPVASPRTRTISNVSDSQSAQSPIASPGMFLAPQSRKARGSNHTSPTAASLLRSVSSMSRVGSPGLERSFSSASATSPGGSRRSSTRRVSSSFQAEHNVRPNTYRANPKRKLDVAVGRIVNKMNVPVNITPAETFKDESGKYWIGSPEPKLYFARILRSRTVMLRVGGGWQELGSFLSTHFDHLFASEIPDKLTPRRSHTQATSPSSDPKWITSASLKASLTPANLPENRSSVPASRSLSHSQHHGLSRSSDSRIPDDLTSLLVKSTSRSPPVSLPNQPRSKSLSIPWRV